MTTLTNDTSHDMTVHVITAEYAQRFKCEFEERLQIN